MLAKTFVDFQKASSIQGILCICDILSVQTSADLQIYPDKSPVSSELHNHKAQKRQIWPNMNLKESRLAESTKIGVCRKSFRMYFIVQICIKNYWIRWSSHTAVAAFRSLSSFLPVSATNLDFICQLKTKGFPLYLSIHRPVWSSPVGGWQMVIAKLPVALFPLPLWHANALFPGH